MKSPNADKANEVVNLATALLNEEKYSEASFQHVIKGIIYLSLLISGRTDEASKLEPELDQLRKKAFERWANGEYGIQRDPH